MSASFAVLTFGCRVNQADSLVIETELRARGASPAPPDVADLVVVNTCSVTATADQGARQAVRRVARANPHARIVLTGCYATRQPQEVAILPNVVRVVPNGDKDHLLDFIDDEWFTTTAARADAGGDDACGSVARPGYAGRTALTLRVQTGCEERCSYCIIPSTRGAGRSQPLAVVLDRLRAAVEAGFKEIVLTGVHLGSYGRDLGDGTSLTKLVTALETWPGDVLFRVSSLEPMDCTREIVHCVARSSRLAPHFHLPLQHASDQMLAAMRRPYAFADYQALIEQIHSLMPHASIGTDLIVGFPGETDEDFDLMRARVAALPLSHLHVFPYSDRPGTAASRLEHKVPGQVVRARGREIRDIGAALTARFRASQVGQVVRALTLDDGWSAVTPNYVKVQLDHQQQRNEWIDLRVLGSEPLRAEVLTAGATG